MVAPRLVSCRLIDLKSACLGHIAEGGGGRAIAKSCTNARAGASGGGVGTVYGCGVRFERGARARAAALGVELCMMDVVHELVAHISARVQSDD